MNTFFEKLKENTLAVLPIMFIVLALHFTNVRLENTMLIGFLVGSVSVILGLTLFLIGVDIGITPLGGYIGNALTKSNSVKIVVIVGFILGFFISIAEPGLLVLANQVDMVTNGQISSITILVVVSLGLAICLVIAFLRIFYNKSLRFLLFILYGIIAVLSFFSSEIFFGISFDASGATTGILAVPFILSLGVGISAIKKKTSNNEEDAFGLVALASSGVIIAMLVLGLATNLSELSPPEYIQVGNQVNFIQRAITILPGILFDGATSLLPLLIAFLLFQKFALRLKPRAFRQIIVGFIFSFIGLILFFLGVEGGFMEVGLYIGYNLTNNDQLVLTIIIAFLIGFVSMLAEPAVYVLTHQIEIVTTGSVKRMAVLIPLCLGVGIALALSVIRTFVPGLHLWHFLLPGYIISVALAFIVPKLFVGIAFDAGGVATGPLTATFTLAYMQGVAGAFEGADLLIDGFGMISMVALFPILTLQIVGIIFSIKAKKEGILENEE